ncbi:MAG: helix-turn-helix domain-containing protein [Acidimicrobiales bacterium]
MLSVEEAGRLLGISRALAYQLVARHRLPHLRLGRRIVVPVAALRALLDDAARRDEGDEPLPLRHRN